MTESQRNGEEIVKVGEGERRERGEQAVVALPDSPENLCQTQEEVRLLETDMCVKEVEGAQGQESPSRQEKACGGDGGALGSCLMAVCMSKFTHIHVPQSIPTSVH